jgi:hypothetical protein
MGEGRDTRQWGEAPRVLVEWQTRPRLRSDQ